MLPLADVLKFAFIRKLNHPPAELYHALPLEIAEHPGNHFPGVPQMVSNGFMGDSQGIAHL